MPRTKTEGPEGSLTIRDAAKKLKVSDAALRNWLREEKELKSAIVKKNKIVFVTTDGLEQLAKFHKERMKNASPALKKAWAARRAGKGKKKESAVKTQPKPKGKKAKLRLVASPKVERVKTLIPEKKDKALGAVVAKGSGEALFMNRALQTVEAIAREFREAVVRMHNGQTELLGRVIDNGVRLRVV